MPKLKLFISSAQKEFEEERQALYQYLQGDALLGNFIEPFLFERTPAKDAPPSQVFLEEVERCDIYLGLLGKEYGFEDEKGVSPTEREFDRASELHKHRLIYLKEVPSEERDPKMGTFVRKVQSELIRKRFSSISELLSGVYASLVELLKDRGYIQTQPFDAAPAQGATLEDIDEEKVERFIKNAQAWRGFPKSVSGSVKETLLHLNLIDESGAVSRAGVLLFGKAPQRFLIGSEVKCAHFHGVEVEKPVPSYQVYKGDVFELVDQSVDFVMSKIRASVGERSEGSQAPVEYEIPRAAVAEGIVNAIAHRDYSSAGSVQVMLFADRLEIWNPGQLPSSLSIEQLRGPHISIPANPLLAEPMYLTGYIERLGTGTRDMIRLCEEAGLREPEFVQEGEFKLVFWRKASTEGEIEGKAGKQRGSTGEVPGKYRGSTGEVSQEVQRLVAIMEGELKRGEIQKRLELRHEDHFREHYLLPALKAELIEMTIPDKPRSSKQRYRLTESGKTLQEELLKEKG